jgi:hypothetical protein
MVDVPKEGGTVGKTNGNGLIYEERVFKGFVEGPGKSASSRDGKRVKRTFATVDGQEWVIWNGLDVINSIFSSINPNDKIKIGYRKQWDSYSNKEINNVQSVVKAVPALADVPKEKPVSIDEPIVNPKALENKQELIQRLKTVQATLKAGVIPYLDELIKSIELTQELK